MVVSTQDFHDNKMVRVRYAPQHRALWLVGRTCMALQGQGVLAAEWPAIQHSKARLPGQPC